MNLSANASNWRQARKLLCIRLDNLGDVVMTTPAIRALKETGPGCHLTLLTSPSASRVAPLVAEIDDVITYDAPWMKSAAARQNSQPDWKVIERLRRGNFDGAVIFTVFNQNPLPAALLAFLADIPLRLGYCRENPHNLLTDWIREPDLDGETRHEVRRQLDLVDAVGCRPQNDTVILRVTEKNQLAAVHKLRETGVNISRPWVIIHPGASAPSRRYMPEAFAEVARRLTVEDNLQIVFTGDRDETALVESIQAMSGRSYSLAGRLTIEEMAGVLQISPLLISNNSGPVHLAAGLGTPVVVLSALTNPQHAPWNVPSRVLSHDVPCKYCYKTICPEGHHNCLRLITPSTVIEAARSLLQETAIRQDTPARIG